MAPHEQSAEPAKTSPREAEMYRHIVAGLAFILAMYFVTTYLLTPLWWKRYEQRHPWVADVPGVTHTKEGIPGDPLNVALIGSKSEVNDAFAAAGWYVADSLGLRSDLKIAEDTVLSKPYDRAPVSHLYLFGRHEDLAYEQPVGDNPRRRHHVRFWQTPQNDPQGRPIWIGAVTYDERVEISRTTGQITHGIAPEVDEERDRLFQQLQGAQLLSSVEELDNFHTVRSGKNGGGNPWRTDGRLKIGTIKSAGPPTPSR